LCVCLCVCVFYTVFVVVLYGVCVFIRCLCRVFYTHSVVLTSQIITISVIESFNASTTTGGMVSWVRVWQPLYLFIRQQSAMPVSHAICIMLIYTKHQPLIVHCYKSDLASM